MTFSFATLSVLNDAEQAIASKLIARLDAKTLTNQLKHAYYDGRNRVRDLGISIPPEMKYLNTVVGWPGTVVDVLEERLDWEGVVLPESDPAEFGIDDIIRTNRMTTEAGFGHLDALIYGVAFMAVGTGSEGEPDPLITTESPLHMTAIWDARSRRVTAALSRTWDPELQRTTGFSLYLPNVTIRCAMSVLAAGFRVVDRDEHNLGRVLVSRLVNRPRAGNTAGRSEITRALRAYTDNAVRTMLGMEVAREFYSAPQRWIMGADEKAFQAADGTPKTAWESYIGRWVALEQGDNDTLPQVGQFAASSPAAFIDQIKMLSQMVSAESAVPATQLGFVSDNPPSADSVRMLEARLVKRAERRQVSFGEARIEAIRLAVLARDGEIPPQLDQMQSLWRDPSTPTRAAAADAVTKLVGAGVLPAQSEVTWELLGFDKTTIERLRTDAAKGDDVTKMLDQLAAGQVTAMDPAELKAKADAFGVLVRSGVDPVEAAARAGLPGMTMTGAVPVSLRQPKDEVPTLEPK